MTGPPALAACPHCGEELRADRAKMNLRVKSCPQDHGLLLEPANLAVLVDGSTNERLRVKVGEGSPSERPCPSCAGQLRSFRINAVDAMGCDACGALWFGTDALRSHVLDVRKRAFGEASFAARSDVHGSGTPLLTAEIVAGILTDYALETDESPNMA